MHNAQDVEPVVITTQTGQQQQHAGESLYLSLSLSSTDSPAMNIPLQ